MKNFDIFVPVEIKFGLGRLEEIGKVVKQYGKKCLLITGHTSKAKYPLYERIKMLLTQAGIEVVHFDGVATNPTVSMVNDGVRKALKHNAEVVIGVGGGSSIDTAKAIAVGVTHTGNIWDYTITGSKKIGAEVLPIIAVPTTSGSGSHVTHIAVITNEAEKFKSALVSRSIYPKVSIVDPELMLTMPPRVTAATGFDALAHAFESYIHTNSSPYTELLALEAMRIICKHLPSVVQNGLDKEGRTQLAWADTLAGICISQAGTTLPHGIAMAIGGHYPQVFHGEALAAIYPAVLEYTYESCIEKCAMLARFLDSTLVSVEDERAASLLPRLVANFLTKMGLPSNLACLNINQQILEDIATKCLKLPDYKAHPKVANHNEIIAILQKSSH